MNCPHDRALSTCQPCLLAAAFRGRHVTHEGRSIPCAVCGEPIEVDSVTNADPECPEMIATPLGRRVWIGVAGDREGSQWCLCCSTACLVKLVTPK